MESTPPTDRPTDPDLWMNPTPSPITPRIGFTGFTIEFTPTPYSD